MSHITPAPVIEDGYGVQVDVTDGPQSFIAIGRTDGEQQQLKEMLERYLGPLWPRRRIIIVPPRGWAANHLTIAALAQTIFGAHRSTRTPTPADSHQSVPRP